MAVYQSLTDSDTNVLIRCWFVDGVGVDVALLLGWNVKCAFLTRGPAINTFPSFQLVTSTSIPSFEVAQHSTTTSLIPGISSTGPLIHHEHSIQLFYSPALCIHTTHRSANTHIEGSFVGCPPLSPATACTTPLQNRFSLHHGLARLSGKG